MLAALLLASALITPPPATPVRGVWLTTTANDALSSPANTAETMRRLKEIGFNTVYVEVWKNGTTQFPSETLRAAIGVDRHPDLHGTRDLLREALEAAHRNGLKMIAWFEYGFMAAYQGTDNELLRLKRDWMTTTLDGKLVSDQNPFIWMNPLRPESQALLLGIIKEAVRNYDLDGIQLDDRIAWPTSMGYDPYTKAIYAQEHGGASPPDDAKDPDWVAWRAAKVTAFAKRLHDELRALKPGLIVSISPAVYPWSVENYACDWPQWQRNGWMSEFVPQVYRATHEAFVSAWKQQLDANPGAGQRLVAGIMVDQGDGVVPWNVLEANLKTLEATGSGHVFWYSRGVLNHYAKEIQAYYHERGSARACSSP
ncbi:MAG: family 10 glycosylhydrolase [Chthonomonadaceae bacterium]|nr:family 10 glycosylhydrolase [Chthonomonadaceae bacterium]